jgi:lipopolysaccharide exporter
MSSGPLFTQILGFLILPIIARMYSSEVFGLYATYSSIIGPLSVFSTMSFTPAIVIADNKSEEISLIRICLISSVIISALTLLLINSTQGFLLNSFNAEKLKPYLWVIPISIFFGGLYDTLRYWNLRSKRFINLSSAKIFQFLTRNTFLLGAGWSGYPNLWAFIFGGLIGSLINIFVLFKGVKDKFTEIFKFRISFQEIKSVLYKYRKFPQFTLWTDLLSRFTLQIPVLALAYFFSQSMVGFYALGLRLLSAPISLVGNSIGEVFFQRASEDKGNIPLLLEKVFTSLVLFSMPLFLTLGIIGEEFFILFFGEEWAEAGVMMQLLSFMIFIRFIISPADYLILINNKQEFSLFLKILISIVTIIGIGIGGIYEKPLLSILLMAIGNCIVYLGYGFYIFIDAGMSAQRIIGIILNVFYKVIPLFLVLISFKYLFAFSSIVVLLLVSGFLVLITYLILIIRDENHRKLFKLFLKRLNLIRN